MSTKAQRLKDKGLPEPRGDVLTLAEVATYLRISEREVLGAVAQQWLPGRRIQGQWRFLKSALDDWLRAPPGQRENLAQLIGAWKDDPYLAEMLERIYEERGRPMTEEGNE